ncbi:hypothetical protein ACP6PL_27295 [Dapis sp. BLCC M126]|uniref:hypothetical protein n=1 Tax=Dapis sp. BLCC M126 TaxID=3400189 RepID=UPI003CEB3308
MNNIWSDKITPDEVNDAKRWWRKKLEQSGYAPAELRINSEKVTYNIETSKIIRITALFRMVRYTSRLISLSYSLK